MIKSYEQEIKEIREKKRVIPATFDPVFKSLLTNKDNRDYLVDLISNITKIPRYAISNNMIILNNELGVEYYDSKKMQTDILVEIENNIINLEMNNSYYEGLFNKNSAYHQKLMVDQYKSGYDYEIKKVIQINFDNFRIFNSKETIIKFQMKSEDGLDVEESYGVVYHVNLEKIRNIWYNKTRKESLTEFDRKLLMLCITNKQSLEEITKGDEDLMKIKKNLEKISNNEKIIGLYDVSLAKEYEDNCRKKEHDKREKELKEKEDELKDKEEMLTTKQQELTTKEDKLDIEKEQLEAKAGQLDIKEEILNNRIYDLARSMLKENMDIDTIKKVTSLKEEEIKNLL